MKGDIRPLLTCILTVDALEANTHLGLHNHTQPHVMFIMLLALQYLTCVCFLINYRVPGLDCCTMSAMIMSGLGVNVTTES